MLRPPHDVASLNGIKLRPVPHTHYLGSSFIRQLVNVANKFGIRDCTRTGENDLVMEALAIMKTIVAEMLWPYRHEDFKPS